MPLRGQLNVDRAPMRVDHLEPTRRQRTRAAGDHSSQAAGPKQPVALSDLGKDAFANGDAKGLADVDAMKRKLILRVSMPDGPQAVEMEKAIAKKALARLR